MVDYEFLEKIKLLTIEALVSDDIFVGILVLKGGNALNLAYDISERGSIDIDFSMAGDFSEDEKSRMRSQADYILNSVFNREGYHVFDVKFLEKPKEVNEEVKDFWGGYKIEFKLVSLETKKTFNNDLDKIRRNAITLHENNSTKFTVDISKYEYIENSKKKDIDGTVVQVYSPEMLALEKLRAICQQTPRYKDIIGSMSQKSRARDFYDIYNLLESFTLDFTTKENIDIAQSIFKAKRVPLDFINDIINTKELHRQSWVSVKQTISQDIKLEEFDFYVDFVIKKFKHLTN